MVVILSIAGAIAVLGSTVHLHFFGEVATSRENAIASHAGRTGLWVLASPLCAWAVLRGGRRGGIAAVVWLGLLAAATPWWWPRRDAGESERPLWHTYGAQQLWLLVGVGVAIGLYCAWRSRVPYMRYGAVIVVLLVAIGCGWTQQHLLAANEGFVAYLRCAPLPGSAEELRTLRADGVWRTLAPARTLESHEYPGCRTGYGSTNQTLLERTFAASDEGALFRESIRGAEGSGWQLESATCISAQPLNWHATFARTPAVGRIQLDIDTSPSSNGLRVSLRVGQPIGVPNLHTARCWDGVAS